MKTVCYHGRHSSDLCDLLEPLSPLSEAMGGREIIPSLLHAIDAFADADLHLKRYRKAVMLKSGSAEDELAFAMASNRVGLRRLERATAGQKTFATSVARFEKERMDPQARRHWERIVKEEIVPDVRRRLLVSSMSSGEMSVWLEAGDSMADPTTWSSKNIRAGVERLPKLTQQLATERNEVADLKPKELANVPAGGVPIWKVIATKIVKILIRVAIEICKTWNGIISKLIEVVWNLVERWVEEKIYGWCRDGRPVEG